MSLPPPPESAPSESARVVLPRDLASFLVELAIALQNHGVYPPGHPFLARSAEAVAHRLDALMRDRGSLALGVAHDQLVIDGVATDPANPVLAGLAARLHRHRVGAITLLRGIGAEESARLLTLLAADPEAGLPAHEALEHVRLHPLSYGNLELAGDVEEGSAGGAEGARAARLWIGLAHAAVSGEVEDTADTAAVAHAINTHSGAAAYDQVIVGHLLQLAEELRQADGAASAEVRRRLNATLAALSPEALRRLVAMGGDHAQRRRFVLDASHGFAADAVVRLVQAAAESEGQTISHAMMRVLAKLASHASARGTASASGADAALRGQLQALVAGWSLDDPNPGDYTLTLQRFAGEEVRPTTRRTAAYRAEPLRLLQMGVEVGVLGPTTQTALQQLVAEGRVAELLTLLDGAPPESTAVEELWSAVANPAALRTLLEAGTAPPAAIDRLIDRMGASALEPLMEQLEARSRVARRTALDRLGRLGAPAGAAAAQRLDDPRWFILRNLLIVIGVAGAPAGFSPAPFLRHEDHRVRREAFKVALRLPEWRSQALGLALADPDAQVQLAGLSECTRGCPPAAVPLVCRRAADAATDPELRVMAIHALERVQDPAALRTLVQLVDGGRTLFGQRRLAPASAEMLAALRVLATSFQAHPEAARLVALARRSPEVEVIRASLPEATHE